MDLSLHLVEGLGVDLRRLFNGERAFIALFHLLVVHLLVASEFIPILVDSQCCHSRILVNPLRELRHQSIRDLVELWMADMNSVQRGHLDDMFRWMVIC